jgi:hypothetical protein
MLEDVVDQRKAGFQLFLRRNLDLTVRVPLHVESTQVLMAGMVIIMAMVTRLRMMEGRSSLIMGGCYLEMK